MLQEGYMSTSHTGESQVPDLENCPCVGATLEKLIQPAILTVLAGEDLHGYRIAERMADMPLLKGHKPDVSGVYRFLRAMEDRGLVVASWDISDRGPAKRLYKLTAAGRECLSHWIETLERHREAIGSLLAMARKASAKARRRRPRHASKSSKVKKR
jgi:DNA-binding PadR family transcriptional regulator